MNLKFLSLVCVAIIINVIVNAQIPQWANTIGNSGADAGLICRILPNSNVIVAGHFSGTIDLDPSTVTVNISSVNNSQDIFLACYSSTGNLIWGFSLGKDDLDGVNALTFDNNSNIYVGGYFRGTNVDFDPGGGTALLTCTGNTSGASDWGGDGFAAKYSSNGVYQWAYAYGSAFGNEAIDAIAIDNNNNVIISGVFKDKIDVDHGVGTVILDATTSGTVFLAKYNSVMQHLWSFATGKPGGMSVDNSIRAVKTDASSNIYIGGFVTGDPNLDFDPGAGTANYSVNGIHDAFVAKYSPAGSHLFSFVIGNSGTDDIYGLDLDASSNIYITGYSISSSIDYDPTSVTANATAQGGGLNIMLASYTSAGVYRWGKLIGNSGTDFGRSLCVKGSLLYTAGMFSNTVNFNPGGNAANQVSAGNTDAYVALYELNGNYKCGFKIGSTNADAAIGITVDASDYVYTTGSFSGSNTDFDPRTGNTLNRSSNGNTDAFLGKYEWQSGYKGYLVGDTICPGEKAYLTYIDTSGGTNVTITYYDGTTYYTKNVQSGVPFEITPAPTTTKMYTLSVISSICFSSFASSQVPIRVNSKPVANAGLDTSICAVPFFQLKGLGGGSYTWSSTQPITNPNSSTPTVPGNVNSTYRLIVSNANGCSDTDEVHVAVLTAVVADAGKDTNVCEVQSFELKGTGMGNYTWSSSQTVTNPNSSTPTVAGNINGIYRLIIINTSGCSDTDEVAVTVLARPVADAGKDTSVCNIPLVQLNGVGGNSYAWYSSQPITNPNSNNPTVSGLVTSDYKLVVTSLSGCTDTDDVKVTALPVPVANAGQDITTCYTTLTQLQGSGGVNYYWYSTIPIINSNWPNPIVHAKNGIFYLVVDNGLGCSDTDDVKLTVLPQVTAYAGNDTVVCPGAEFVLKGRVNGANVTPKWVSAAVLDNPLSLNIKSKTDSAEYYHLIAIDSFGCTDTSSVKVSVIPRSDFKIKPENTSLCAGKNIDIVASGADSFKWWGEGVLANTGSINVSPVKDAKYFVEVKDKCGYTDTLTAYVAVKPLPKLKLSGSNNIDCSKGESVLKASGAEKYKWSPPNDLDKDYGNEVRATPRQNTAYTVTGISEFGCETDTTFTLYAWIPHELNMITPNAFTPNNDGLNDCYRVKVNFDFNHFEMQVNNRWGEAVYRSKAADDCWDGRYKGRDAELGTYYYLIKIHTDACGTIIRKGDILLLK